MLIEKAKRKTVSTEKVFRYGLEPYGGRSTKHECPNCGARGKFTRYIDLETGEYLADHIGRCDREVNCGYHMTPPPDFLKGKPSLISPTKVLPKLRSRPKEDYDLLGTGLFLQSMHGRKKCNLRKFLEEVFPIFQVRDVFDLYFVGHCDLWEDSTVFWQVDPEYGIRTGKVMHYIKESGKRVKEPFPRINWMHSKTQEDFNLNQTLFGAHRIHENPKTVHIVESEKTALVMALKSPDKVWMASGGLQNLNADKIRFLEGTKVILHPDKGLAYEKWKSHVKSRDLEDVTEISVSNFLEKNEEVNEGDDLADLVLKDVKV
jgi:hypothetical protein